VGDTGPLTEEVLRYDKVRQSFTSKSKSKKHGPITGSDQNRSKPVRACDWSMLFAFSFARNILAHFVIDVVEKEEQATWMCAVGHCDHMGVTDTGPYDAALALDVAADLPPGAYTRPDFSST